MFASSGLGCRKINGFAKALGVDRRNIKKAMERCLQLNIEKDPFWVGQRRGKRFDSLP
jgi:hypothetical protein